MKTIDEIQNEIIGDFEMYSDWADKYEYIIDMGKELKPISGALKIEDNIIKGCQSRVWLIADYENGKLNFQADSDAIITKGLVGMLTKVLSGHSPKEIERLSPTRANGLLAMIKQMKTYGLAYMTKEKMI